MLRPRVFARLKKHSLTLVARIGAATVRERFFGKPTNLAIKGLVPFELFQSNLYQPLESGILAPETARWLAK